MMFRDYKPHLLLPVRAYPPNCNLKPPTAKLQPL